MYKNEDEVRGRVLVVDDIHDWCEELKELLVEEGFAVEIAGNKYTALNFLHTQRFDLAIIDVNLTDEADNIDGLLLNRFIQENLKDVFVVLISARSLNPQELESIKPAIFIGKEKIWNALNDLIDQFDDGNNA